MKILKNLSNSIWIFSKKFFSINKFDNHLVMYIFGFHIRKKLAQYKQEISIHQNGLNQTERNPRIVASLTTFPQRITIVKETIKTLLTQTVKPDELVLYLAESQFPKKEDELPNDLLDLKNYGLTIKWCEDLRSYKKLLPALKDYPNDIIITFDDDIYYPNDIIERLYNSYLTAPDCIHTNRARRLYTKNGNIYSKSIAELYWVRYNDCTFNNTITGCGGVLYPPNSLNEKIFDTQEIKNTLPTQDDIWFWSMALLNNTKIKMVASFDIQLPTVENSQEFGLSKINSKSGNGINAIDAVRIMADKYPEIKEKIV